MSNEFSKGVVDDFEKRNIVKRSMSFTKEQSESSGLNASSRDEHETAIATKVSLDKSGNLCRHSSIYSCSEYESWEFLRRMAK